MKKTTIPRSGDRITTYSEVRKIDPDSEEGQRIREQIMQEMAGEPAVKKKKQKSADSWMKKSTWTSRRMADKEERTVEERNRNREEFESRMDYKEGNIDAEQRVVDLLQDQKKMEKILQETKKSYADKVRNQNREIAQLKSQLKELKERAGTKNAKAASLAQSKYIEDLKRDNRSLKSKCKQAKKELLRQDDIIEALSQEVENFEQLVEDLKTDNQSLKEEIEEQSKSGFLAAKEADLLSVKQSLEGIREDLNRLSPTQVAKNLPGHSFSDLEVSLEDKFRWMKYVDFQADGCWDWTGGTTSSGKPSFYMKQGTQSGAKFGYQAFVGPIPEDLIVTNTCGNPLCMRFDHWELITRQELGRRSKRKNK